MHLRHGETILRTIKRHSTPYLLKILKIILVVIPLYIAIFLIGRETSGELLVWLLGIFSFFTGIIIGLISIDFLFDKVIITTKRVIWINWKSMFKKEEHEAELLDIQDIKTREKGVLSKLRIFDYGFLEIETASSKTCIVFTDCPNPDGIKHFILSQMEKSRGGIHEKREPPKEEEWSVN